MRRSVYLFACISLAVAICLGALGAHKLKDEITADQLASFKTGVFYQIVHAVALLAIANLTRFVKSRKIKIGIELIKYGPLVFSVSIYLLATGKLTGVSAIAHILGPITPIGGLMMIVGWVLLAMGFYKTRFNNE